MKTIREIVMCTEPWLEDIIKLLEARERERDYAERDRVRKAIALGFKVRLVPTADFLMEYIYRPPESEMLPAGYYEITHPNGKKTIMDFSEPTEPTLSCKYRRLVYADDPPPEVIGRKQNWLRTS